MEPIRVLHILHSMNRGGAENAIMNYYRHIDRDKVQFDFLLTEPNECLFEKEINGLGGRVFRVPLLRVSNPFPYFKGLRLFYMSHHEYSIVHSHTSSKSFFPLFIAKAAGIPVRICHSHGSKSEKGWKGKIRNLLKLPLKFVATHFLACGKEAAIWLYGRSFMRKGKVLIFPNVIECNKFDFDEDKRKSLRSKLGISIHDVVLGSTSRFSPVKNLEFALSVFSAFNKIVKDARLLLVGDGELKDSLIEKANNDGLKDMVSFVGVVPNVYDYLQVMDFFLLPSINEGIPLSLIEAQVSGLNCFASEGVPKEADLTGLVSFIPLDKGPDYWAKRICDSIDYVRKSGKQDIVDLGYDAQTSASKLERFYLEAFEHL